MLDFTERHPCGSYLITDSKSALFSRFLVFNSLKLAKSGRYYGTVIIQSFLVENLITTGLFNYRKNESENGARAAQYSGCSRNSSIHSCSLRKMS